MLCLVYSQLSANASPGGRPARGLVTHVVSSVGSAAGCCARGEPCIVTRSRWCLREPVHIDGSDSLKHVARGVGVRCNEGVASGEEMRQQKRDGLENSGWGRVLVPPPGKDRRAWLRLQGRIPRTPAGACTASVDRPPSAADSSHRRVSRGGSAVPRPLARGLLRATSNPLRSASLLPVLPGRNGSRGLAHGQMKAARS